MKLPILLALLFLLGCETVHYVQKPMRFEAEIRHASDPNNLRTFQFEFPRDNAVGVIMGESSVIIRMKD